MQKYFYNFIFDGNNQGYSYLYLSSEKLVSYTRFLTEENTIYSNSFVLKLEGENILACKHGDADWVDFSNQPAHHYPSCAYPLFLTKVTTEPYNYRQVSEDDGSFCADMRLLWQGDDIVEYHRDRETRRFTMLDGVPIRINWGGAMSHLCRTSEEAIQGSGIEFIECPLAT